MKRLLILVALAILGILPCAAQTGVRFDSHAWTAATNVPIGAQAPMFTVPYAQVFICTDSSCGTQANVYSNQSLTNLLAQPLTADSLGRYGFWAASGTYWVNVCSPSASCAGNYVSLVGGSGGGVTSLNVAGSSALTGGVTIACGNGLNCTQSGQTITITPATAFAITSFTGGETVELGTPVVNPTFAATYSTAPASAQIANTDGIDSPLVLTSPFTSGTVTGTFTHSTSASTTFTLSATQGSTQTATQTISWQPAIFGGVGSSGATSSVTASGTTAVLSTGDALARTQLGAETVGPPATQWNLNPSGQVIYLLLTGGSHTFVDANTGFPFAFNAPIAVTFVNAQGTTVTMYLYASTNPLYGNYKPKVAS